MSCYGQIDYGTFEKFVLDFYARSQDLLDDWQLLHSNQQVYLVKNSSINFTENREMKNSSIHNNNVYKLEHHIVYNPAYAVPVLYFRMFDFQTGTVL